MPLKINKDHCQHIMFNKENPIFEIDPAYINVHEYQRGKIRICLILIYLLFLAELIHKKGNPITFWRENIQNLKSRN